MTAPIPPIRPYLVVSDAAAAVEFYKNAFSAVQYGEAHVMPGTGKIMHVRLLINGGLIMLCDDFSQMMVGGVHDGNWAKQGPYSYVDNTGGILHVSHRSS